MKKKRKEWRTSEVRFVIENAGRMTHRQIAEHLGRSPCSVSRYIIRHLLPAGCCRSHYRWTDSDDACLLSMIDSGCDLYYVCQQLGYRHSVDSIKKRVRFLRQK